MSLDRESATQQAIVGGTVDTEHRSVVAITSPQNPYPSYCTATVISPTVLITAAHCVVDAQNHHADVFVYFGDAIGDGGVSIPVVESVAHPDFELTQGNSANDIGLLRLASEAPEPPLAFGEAPVEGTAATLVGYGYDSMNETGMGTRRQHPETIGSVSTGEFALPMSGSCDGDSGGPILVEGEHGPTVVGIHSSGDCANISFEARIDPVMDSFVLPFVNGSATCETDGACAYGCASPDPDCEPSGAGGAGGAAAGGTGGGGASPDPHDDQGGCQVASATCSNNATLPTLAMAVLATWILRHRRRSSKPWAPPSKSGLQRTPDRHQC